MKITDLLSKETVSIRATANSKEEVIKKAVKLISKSGAIKDVAKYEAGVFKREEESTTGIGEGIAIPHCKSDAVAKPALCAMVIPQGVDYDALDGEKVKLLFLIAAPNTKENVHLEVLARLSTLLMDESFKDKLLSVRSTDAFLKAIDDAEKKKIAQEKREAAAAKKVEEARKAKKTAAKAPAKATKAPAKKASTKAAPAKKAVENKPAEVVDTSYPRVLAVTACPTGIAHTYMAEQSLKDQAKKMGVSIKVETNGSGGVKNLLTADEIEHAEGIVVAADIGVEMDRFNGKRVVKSAVAKGIHEPEKLINAALDPNTPVFNSGKKAEKHQEVEGGESWGRAFYKHLMSGVSHMLPFVIGGGLLVAIAFLIDTIYCAATGQTPGSSFGTMTEVSRLFKTLGGGAMGVMLPVFAGFIAFSIAGRPGLAVGFTGGLLATWSDFSISNTIYKFNPSIEWLNTTSSAGFLGAMAAGFLGGAIVKWLMKITSKFPKSLEGLKPTLIYPLFGILLIGVVMYLLNTPFAFINVGFNTALTWMGKNNLILVLGALLAGMMAIDMGGPINKAAYVFGTACLSEAVTDPANATIYYEIMAAVMIGGMVPPLGIALSSSIFRNKYSKKDREGAVVNYLMGLSFITEGAIPYAAADPLRVIPSCVVGSAVAGLLSVVWGCTLRAPHGGIFVFATVGNWYWYLLALAIGTVVTALLLGILKKKVVEEEPVAE